MRVLSAKTGNADNEGMSGNTYIFGTICKIAKIRTSSSQYSFPSHSLANYYDKYLESCLLALVDIYFMKMNHISVP